MRPWPASALTILVLICLTGGLHMDGLADTADGFFSARTRNKMMEIMRDSRIGVMAVVFVLLLKVSLLTMIAASSRWVVILIMTLGAVCELAEITPLLVGVIYYHLRAR